MHRLKIALLTLVITFAGFGVFGLANASAATNTSQQDACAGLSQLDANQNCGSGESTFTKVVKAAVTILSVVVGIAAVIMIIFAGFKYITSGGDASKVTSAKTALIYALVGVVVAVSAQFLVHFVLNQATVCPYDSKLSLTDPACVAPKP